MNQSSQNREIFREWTLKETGLVGPANAHEELRRSQFFIETMEQYIATSEEAEVHHLAANAETLSDEAKDEFWQWNYPIHWQDIFGVRIRSAFCIQLCSLIEATLGDMAHRVQIIERCQIEINHIKGSTLEKHKRYLTAFGKFNGPDADLWEQIGFVFRIRNIHVHQQGHAGEISDQKFKNFLATIPEIGIEHDFIELNAGSCTALLNITKRFHDALLVEFSAYRKRVLEKEPLPSQKDQSLIAP